MSNNIIFVSIIIIIPQHFIEPEGSIPYSQETSTGSYPEPYQSNPNHPILFLYDPF
jgi:hypothetical protein